MCIYYIRNNTHSTSHSTMSYEENMNIVLSLGGATEVIIIISFITITTTIIIITIINTNPTMCGDFMA